MELVVPALHIWREGCISGPDLPGALFLAVISEARLREGQQQMRTGAKGPHAAGSPLADG